MYIAEISVICVRFELLNKCLLMYVSEYFKVPIMKNCLICIPRVCMLNSYVRGPPF